MVAAADGLTRRFAAQLLAGRPAAGPVEVAERLLAIQAQDLRGGQLAVRARSRARSVADIDRAFNEREVIVTWVNRGTLHLIRSEDYPLLQALTTPQLATANRRRLQQEGVSPAAAERGVKAIVRAIERDGPRTREELRAALVRAKVPVAGQALVHVLMLASLRGLIVRGPMRGTRQAFVLVRDWLDAPPGGGRARDRDAMLGELAVRYLAGHGPASERDLVWWAGLPLRDVRTGLRIAEDRIVALDDELIDLKRRRSSTAAPRARLLGPWEPLIVGWTERDWVLGPHRPRITVGGLFNPFALAGGHAVALWRWEKGRPSIEPFTPIARRDEAALERDADAIERFFER